MAGLADIIGGSRPTTNTSNQNIGTGVLPISTPAQTPKRESFSNKVADFFFGSTIETSQNVNTILGKLDNAGPVGKIASGLASVVLPPVGALQWQKYIGGEERIKNTPWLQPQEEKITPKKVIGDVLGTTAEIGSVVVPGLGSGIFKGVKWLGKAAPFVGAATSGSLWGGAFSGAKSLSAGNSIQQSIKDAGKGAIVGSVLGLGGKVLEPLLDAGLSRTATWLEQSNLKTSLNTIGKNLSSVTARYDALAKEIGLPKYNLAQKTMLADAEAKQAITSFETGLMQAYKDSGVNFNQIRKQGFEFNNQKYTGEDASLWYRYNLFKNDKGKVVDFIKNTNEDILEKATKTGLNIQELGGEYHTHDVLMGDFLTPYTKPGTLQNILIYDLQDRGVVATEEQGVRFINDWKRIVDGEKGALSDNSVIEYFAQRENSSIQYAKDLFNKEFGDMKNVRETGKFLERTRKLNIPIINPFEDEAAAKYVANSMNTVSMAKNLGGISENGDTFGDFTQHAKAVQFYSKQNNLTSQATKKMTDELELLQKTTLKRFSYDKDINTLSRTLRDLGSLRLTFAQIQNLSQGITNSAMITDVPSMIGGVLRSFTKAGQNEAMMSGATNTDMIRNAYMPGMAETDSFASKWLDFWRFGQSEQWNRTVTANTTKIYLDKVAKQIGVAQKAGDKELVNYLRLILGDFGLDANKVVYQGKVAAEDVQKAMFLGAGKGQFLSRPEDLPVFASNPIGKLFFQFKSFGYMQTKLLKDELTKDLSRGKYGKSRALKTVVLLATLFPLSTEVAQDIKSLITQKQRPTNALDRYLDDINYSGAMGYLSDIVSSIKYGDLNSITSPPVVSTISDTIVPIAQTIISPKTKQADLDKQIDSILSAFGIPASASRTYGQWLGLRKKTKPKKELSSTLQSLGIVKK